MKTIVRIALLFVIGILILQSLGYGVGFFFDPAGGVGEFASPPVDPEDELTIALVGLVGVGMLGTVAMLALAVTLIVKANPAGTYIAMTIGAVYVLTGASAWRAGWTWDASFYACAGALLMVLAIAHRWLEARTAEPQ
ncbi:MAG: hypothetical protein HKN73_07445 [Gemmatimonadetes bacterium]|nr:hypothetical protein [Gemmatimonadota bacterium]